jgi:hypothetical protein
MASTNAIPTIELHEGDVEWGTQCSVCHAQIIRRNRNRLSNCGHMRMSGGAWVPKEQKSNGSAKSTDAKITLIVSLDQARKLAMALSVNGADLASFVQDQIIEQLGREIGKLIAAAAK